jgi:rubrerythrin
MRKMTEANLKDAFAGESQAHMKYLVFAEVADAEKRPNLARLFRAIAYAEQVHATNHLRELGLVRTSPDNLQEAIAGETFEVEEMYPAYHAVAELQGEKGAVRSAHYALEAEKIHAAMYATAREWALAGEDAKIGKVHVCAVCGHTVEDTAPERCPICQAPRAKYKSF